MLLHILQREPLYLLEIFPFFPFSFPPGSYFCILVKLDFLEIILKLFANCYIQGVSKNALYEIGTPGGPNTIHRVKDHSKMLSNTFFGQAYPSTDF